MTKESRPEENEAADAIGVLKDLKEEIKESVELYDKVVKELDDKAEAFASRRDQEIDLRQLLDKTQFDIRMKALTECQQWIDDNFDESVIEDINKIEATKWKRVTYNVSVRNSVDAVASLAGWALGETGFSWNMPGPGPSRRETRKR